MSQEEIPKTGEGKGVMKYHAINKIGGGYELVSDDELEKRKFSGPGMELSRTIIFTNEDDKKQWLMNATELESLEKLAAVDMTPEKIARQHEINSAMFEIEERGRG
jgi:hypothetical protein